MASRSREPQLLGRPSRALSRHVAVIRTGLGPGRDRAAAPAAGRSRRRGRSGRSTRPARSPRAASRASSAGRLAGPVKASSAPGSATITSPRLAKLASTPAVVGCVITEMNAAGVWCRTSTAQTVFGSCMSERIPSCMRAPPEAVTQTSGTPLSAARSHARANFSPTALPIEPPMKAKSMTASSQGRRSIAGRAGDERVAEPRGHLGLGDPLGVRAEIEEAERIGGAQVLVLLVEGTPVGELVDPARARAPGSGARTAGRRAEALARARRPGSGSGSSGRCSGAASRQAPARARGARSRRRSGSP